MPPARKPATEFFPATRPKEQSGLSTGRYEYHPRRHYQRQPAKHGLRTQEVNENGTITHIKYSRNRELIALTGNARAECLLCHAAKRQDVSLNLRQIEHRRASQARTLEPRARSETGRHRAIRAVTWK